MTRISGYLLAILPKFTSGLSALGSCMIISQVLMSKKNRANKQQRIVCAMSFIDVIVSSVWFLTNLFIPKNIEDFPWATGNISTCNAQGFVVQFSISSIMYNAALSLYYLLVLKFNYKDKQLEIVEKWIHIFPITFGLVTAIVALSLDVYNFADWDCWIAPSPGGGDYRLATTLQWAFFFAPLWCAILYATFNMHIIFVHVRKQEKLSTEWIRKNNFRPSLIGSSSLTGMTSSGIPNEAESQCDEIHFERSGRLVDMIIDSNDSSNDSTDSLEDREHHSMHQPISERPKYMSSYRASIERSIIETNEGRTIIKMKHTRRVAQQGVLYVGAFFITWMFPTISRLFFLFRGTIPPALVVLSGTFIPSQGFFNALVYFRLRFILCKKDHQDKSKLWVVRRIIRLTLCPCTESQESRYNVDDGKDVEPSFQNEDKALEKDSSSSFQQHRYSSHRASIERSSVPNPKSMSYPSFPSNLSSEQSCFCSFVSDTEKDTEETQDAEVGPESAAEAIANALRPPTRKTFYQRAQDMVHESDESKPFHGNQPEWVDISKMKSYRDILDYRKITSQAKMISREKDILASFSKLSDLSTIKEAVESERVPTTSEVE